MSLPTNPYESNFSTDVEVANGKYARILKSLITTSGHHNQVKERLSGRVGCFTEGEAATIVADACSSISPNNTNSEYIWAAGVLTFFLLCGHQYLKNSDDVDFYNELDLGPPLGSRSWVKMIQNNDGRFPSRKWETLSDAARSFIVELTSKRPGDRPCPLEASNHAWVLSTLDFEFTQDLTQEPGGDQKVGGVDPFGAIFATQVILFSGRSFALVLAASGSAARSIKSRLGMNGARRPLGCTQRYFCEKKASQIISSVLLSIKSPQPPDWNKLSDEARQFVMYLTTGSPSVPVAANHEWILTNLDVDWDDPFDDGIKIGSGVVVKQHVRKRPNTKATDARKKQKQSPRRVTMDVDTLRALTTIQKANLAESKKRSAENPDPDKQKSVQAWQTTMIKMRKQSRKSKGRLKAVKTKAQREEEERKKRELDEWCALYDEVGFYSSPPETDDLNAKWERFITWFPVPEGAYMAR